MRNVFCQSLVGAAQAADFVFLTGDLGYLALEPLREAMGNRFLNAGVAEQNMVSVGAGLAKAGLRPWLYSIAPFLYARPFEQIRNDVCFHKLPVVLVGNGGGYGYGVMGATHHALEDYGTLLCLPHICAYVPAFDDDIDPIVHHLFTIAHPAYLRLGVGEKPAGAIVPRYSPWRQLVDGKAGVVLAVGPLAGSIWAAIQALNVDARPALWALCELPFQDVPPQFLENLARSQRLVVAEEHVAQGGAGRLLAQYILEKGISLKRFRICSALGYPSGKFGSQRFHRHECGLDALSILRQLGGEFA